MLWKSRYTPVEDEHVLSMNRSPDSCRDILEDWCVETQESMATAQQFHAGIVLKPFGKGAYRAHFQFDSPQNTRQFYYKHYFLRVWITPRDDGGCDLHYQRVFDSLTGALVRPLGGGLIGAAILWIIIVWKSAMSWMYLLSMFMIWCGLMMVLTNVEKEEQGAGVGDLFEKAIKAFDRERV